MKVKLSDNDKELIEWLRTVSKDQFEHWKYFEDRANRVSEGLWTTGTWLVAILGAALVLPFTADFIRVVEGAKPLAVQSPIPLFCIAVFGLAFGIYTLLVLNDLRGHIGRNWLRANFVQTGKENPPEFRKTGKATWRVLVTLIFLQLAAFAALAILAIIKFLHLS